MSRLRRIVALRLGPALLVAGLASMAKAQESAPPSDTPAASSFMPSLPTTLSGVPGTWDLSRDGTSRRCVLTLTEASGSAGRKLSFPAGCRRALPILNGIAGWLFTEEAVRLVDKDVRPVLAFKPRPDARSFAASPEAGESYSLVPLQIASPGAAEAATPNPTTSGPRDPLARPASAATDQTLPQPGLYALDRFKDQDVCRVELQPGEAEKPAPVRLLDGCRDNGILVFDPAAWLAAKGRITLRAKRGHAVELVPAGEGRWRRDPEVGTTFVLRRVDP